MSDDKPPEKPTVEIEKPPPWAIEMARNVAAQTQASVRMEANMGALANEFSLIRVDVRSLQQWRVDEERRRDEVSSIKPPPPLTSERVREVIEAHPSQMDLAEQAKLAKALIALDDERAKVARLEATAATKADVAALEKKFAAANAEQTTAIVAGVKAGVTDAVNGAIDGAKKNPTVRKLAYALAGLLVLAINSASVYLATHTAQTPPTQQVQP